jgi:hypothetical protein
MRFARWVFRLAGIYGLIVLLPQYFMEERIGRDDPPPITHPEHFYAFLGVAVAWQVAFLVIAQDPVRFRPMMIPAILEKSGFAIAAPILFIQRRVSGVVLAFGIMDLILGLLFLAAFQRTRAATQS